MWRTLGLGIYKWRQSELGDKSFLIGIRYHVFNLTSYNLNFARPHIR